MANKMNSTKVVTGVVRLSYANVWEPASINGSNPKYSVSLIIPKSDKQTLDAINAAVDAAIKEGVAKFGGKIPNKAALKLPLRDGDTERDDEAYKNSFFVVVRHLHQGGALAAVHGTVTKIKFCHCFLLIKRQPSQSK